MNRAVFLDRDGTIIEEKNYLCRPEDVVIFPGAAAALARLQRAAADDGNVFDELLAAVRVCSLGQISHALYEVGGQYRRGV